MTTYNTGNPIGSTEVKDLYDNAENLDRAVNDFDLTWTDRLGRTRKTVYAIEQSAPLAVDAADRAEQAAVDAGLSAGDADDAADRAEAARDAAVIGAAGVYPDTATGLSDTAEGEYFSVPSADSAESFLLYRHDPGPVATLIKAYPASNEQLQAFLKESDYLEVTAADGSVLLRADARGVHAPGDLTADSVGARYKGGAKVAEISGGGDKLATIEVTARNGDQLASFGAHGASFESAQIKRLGASKDKRLQSRADSLLSGSVFADQGLKQVNHIILIGRSLADGRGIPRYTESRYRNAFGGNNQAVTGLNPNDTGYESLSAEYERFPYLGLDHCMELLKRKKGVDPLELDCRFVWTGASVGGTVISDLIPLTLPRIEGQIISVKALCDEAGLSYNFAGCVMCHADGPSEVPGGTGNQYQALVEGYFEDIRNLVEQHTGKVGATVPFFIIPQSGGGLDLEGECTKAYERMTRADEYIFHCGPSHFMERKTAEVLPSADGIHLSGYGTIEGGIYLGRALYRRYFEGSNPNGMLPIRCWSVGSAVYLKVDRYGLEKRALTGNNSTYTLLTANSGFRVTNKTPGESSAYSQIAVTDVTIEGPDLIKISLASPPPDGYYLSCGNSDIVHPLRQDLYGDQSTDGTIFEVYEPLINFDMRIEKHA